MQSYFNQTSKFFKAQNLELIKVHVAEFYRTQKAFMFQVLEFFLTQIYKTIRTDEFRVVALIVSITFFFNLLFWFMFSRTKQIIKKLEEEVEKLRNERYEEVEKLKADLAEKIEERIDSVEIEALGMVKEALEKIDVISIQNNVDLLFEDIGCLEDSLALLRKEHARFLSVKKSVSKLKEECAKNSKFIGLIEEEISLISADIMSIKDESKNDTRNESEADADDSDYVPSEDEEVVAVPVKKVNPISIETYNEKSFAVYGYTKNHKETLRALGGKWCPNLVGRKGWIFSNKKRNDVDVWFSSLPKKA